MEVITVRTVLKVPFEKAATLALPTFRYPLQKANSKNLKLGFQKLNKILVSQVRFFGYIIFFRSTKMLAEIADLSLCTLTFLRPYILASLCPCALMSCQLLSAPLSRVSYLGLMIFQIKVSVAFNRLTLLLVFCYLKKYKK